MAAQYHELICSLTKNNSTFSPLSNEITTNDNVNKGVKILLFIEYKMIKNWMVIISLRGSC